MDALTKPQAPLNRHLEIAVLVPCLNEAAGIASVVESFRRALPGARIYVYDNASVDDTFGVAERAGAIARREPVRGKGNVVRRMFADVEADVYVLVDGDGTYDAPSAPKMIDLLCDQQLDMVCGKRIGSEQAAYRQGHRLGNRALTGLVSNLFGNSVTDILSGYRVMSRRFVKSFPALSKGFEIETELTVHALDLRVPIAEIATPYGIRAPGTISKLNTWRDGWRILRTIARLVKEERPFALFRLHRRGVGAGVGQPGHPATHRVPGNRAGATYSHGGVIHRTDAGGGHELRVRPDPRHRHARPPRAQAHALPAARPQRKRERAPMTPAFRYALLWLAGSLLMVVAALSMLSASYAGGEFGPSNGDAFYHAARILDSLFSGEPVIAVRSEDSRTGGQLARLAVGLRHADDADHAHVRSIRQ